MSVLRVGAVFFVIAALAYAVTRSGIRVTFHGPLSVPDEVLLGLAALSCPCSPCCVVVLLPRWER
jgi:hypothetical protein